MGLTWDEALDLTMDPSEWRDDLPDVLLQHEEGLRSKIRSILITLQIFYEFKFASYSVINVKKISLIFAVFTRATLC